MKSKIRTYSELSKLKTFRARFDYLQLRGRVGEQTFGFDRYLNQVLYRSKRWLSTRDEVIVRDDGCDLGVLGFEIFDKVIVHHLNPLTIEDIEDYNETIFDLNNLICTSHRTHMAIHYGDESLLPKPLVERRPGDTTLW
jgi:hypothetical protein